MLVFLIFSSSCSLKNHSFPLIQVLHNKHLPQKEEVMNTFTLYFFLSHIYHKMFLKYWKEH
jgi:hypothetical protein